MPFGLIAATVWLTSTHIMRQENATVRSNGIMNDGQHLLFVQNTAHELADEVLKQGGVFQVGDRVEIFSRRQKSESPRWR